MKFNLTILFCLLFISAHSQRRLSWVFNTGTNTSHDRAYDIVEDASGNAYVTGYFQGTADFDPSSSVTNNLVSAGGTDIFIAKFGSARELLWAISIGGASNDEGLALDVDGAGNVYVTGTFQGTDIDFDHGAGIDNLSSNGDKDIFIVKYDKDGVYQSSINIGGTGEDRGLDIGVDGNSDVYITGSFEGTNVNFDPSGSELYSSVGDKDIFISKYSSAMAFVWTSTYGNTSVDEGACLAIDKLNNVYVGGSFTNAAGTGIDFDNGAGSNTLTPTFGTAAAFIAKYSSVNAHQDAFLITGTTFTNAVVPSAMTIDDTNNDIYITGSFDATNADFDPSGTANLTSNASFDIFVAKYSTTFVYDWAFNIGNSSTNSGADITLDATSNVYVTGWFQGTNVDFDPDGAATNLLSSVGVQDIFVAKYDNTGAHVEAFSVGSSADDIGFGITVGSAGDIFVVGYFNGTNIDFDPATVNTVHVSTNGSDDIFIVKYHATEQALPVELVEFKGALTNEGVALVWETASEENNSHFDVEWSKDGKSFEKIGLVEGFGTTIEAQSYSFLHESAVYGENYYRLKQVDFDGAFEYTPVIIIDIEGRLVNSPKIYPNPAKSYLFVDVSEKTNCQIIDLTGKIIKEYELTSGRSIDISELASGTYFIRIGEKTQKFIVE